MSIDEMKWEMVKTIDHMPDNLIAEALEALKKLNQSNWDQHFQKVLQEDMNLLKRLAQ